MVCFFGAISSFRYISCFSLSLQQEDATIWAEELILSAVICHSEERGQALANQQVINLCLLGNFNDPLMQHVW
jgi:hypothetical protein